MVEKKEVKNTEKKEEERPRKKGLFSSLLGGKKSTSRSAGSTEPDPKATKRQKDTSSNESKNEQPVKHSRRSPLEVLFQAPDISQARSESTEPTVTRKTRKRSLPEQKTPVEKKAWTSEQANSAENERSPEQTTTRLEAKKQRRKDPREVNRRRHFVTETEFLVRRESVTKTMIVRSQNGKIRVGVLEDDILVEHYVAKHKDNSLIGNIYLGKVQNVLPSMEAAFVDIGRGRNAVLYSGEIDWSANGVEHKARRIELALQSETPVLVQITKDPVGHKGARLTSQISLPGRYLVYVPGNTTNGISRKLPDTERSRLKKILKNILPEAGGVIVRTAAEGVSEEKIKHDIDQLVQQWEKITAKLKTAKAPSLLHSEPDLLIKIIRDVFNEDFEKIIISGDDAHKIISSYLTEVAPDLLQRVEVYSDQEDIFDRYRVNEQIEKALERKVWLPSGGSLVFDRTEAMTVIDVNTGKFIGSGGNLEETVTKNNLEAAEEIIRQLRLRDIGGIIVIDFIDMVLESNRDLVLRRLIECLSRDRTKHQVAEVTSLGLVQMTRKKLGLGLWETFTHSCSQCGGKGFVFEDVPSSSSQSQQRRNSKQNTAASSATTSSDVAKQQTQTAKKATNQIANSSTKKNSSKTNQQKTQKENLVETTTSTKKASKQDENTEPNTPKEPTKATKDSSKNTRSRRVQTTQSVGGDIQLVSPSPEHQKENKTLS